MTKEFFTIVDGRKTDAPLHDEIMDGVDDLDIRIVTARKAVRDGMTEITARMLYEIPADMVL